MSVTASSDEEALIIGLLSKASVYVPSNPNIIIHSKQTMGFTGALVTDVTITDALTDSESSNFFIKYIVPDKTVPAAKLARNIASYRNEMNFLKTTGPSIKPTLAPNVIFPSLLGYYESPDESEFIIVTSSLSNSFVTTAPSTCTATLLDVMASFHSSTLITSPTDHPSIWEIGTHTRHASSAMPKTAAAFDDLCESFIASNHSSSPTFQMALENNVGRLLQEGGESILNSLSEKRRCLVHGDFKLGNFMWDKGGGGEVAMFDFQWSGGGTPAIDLAYFILQCLSVSELSYVDSLVDTYFERLQHHGGVSGEYTRPVFDEELTLALVDMARWIFSYRFSVKPQTPELFSERRQKDDPNVGAYMKYIEVVEWLTKKLIKYYAAAASS